jgi:N-dimethylarginine dimethylaminohydrolase
MSRLLVCPPDYFSIDYEINPWMRRSNVVAPERAIQQWHRLDAASFLRDVARELGWKG